MTARFTTLALVVVAAGAALIAVATPASAALRPTVTALGPAADSAAGGQRVTVTGAGFKHVTKVLFGHKAGTHVHRVSAHKLTVTAPGHAIRQVHVRVVTAVGKSAKNGPADKFTYVGAPRITNITPRTGDPAGNVHIEINGKNLRDVQKVVVGGQRAPVTNISPPIVPQNGKHVLVTVPPMAEGSYDVVVTTPYGTTTPDARSRYHYAPSPAWKLQDPPPPGTTSGTSRFYDVDCLTGTCYAVGSSGTSVGAHDNLPLLDVRQADGTWTRVDVQPPPGVDSFTDADLTKIVCAKQGLCVISGGDAAGFGFDVIGSGADWTTSPAPALESDRFGTALACGGNRCAEFAEFTEHGVTKVAAAVWSNGSWTVHEGPALKARHGTDRGPVPSMTCPSATKCMVVDTYGRRQMIAVHIPMTGTAELKVDYLPWQPFDSNHVATVTGIGCASGSSCVAIGTEFTPKDDPPDLPAYSFLERYEHGVWTEKHFALPSELRGKHATADWNGYGVDCSTTGKCYVVGRLNVRWTDATRHAKQAATFTRIDATGQHSEFAAVPDQYVGDSYLSHVFCGVRPSCVAVGAQTVDPFYGSMPYTQFTLRLDTGDRPAIFTGPHFDEGQTTGAETSCSGPGDCVEAGSLLFQDPDGGGGVTLRYQGWLVHS